MLGVMLHAQQASFPQSRMLSGVGNPFRNPGKILAPVLLGGFAVANESPRRPDEPE
jgi:hypothetical protein